MLDPDQQRIFVFGSNLAGRHGAGSALEAFRNYGAIYGQGVGLQGRSYAIPTKDKWFNVLSLTEIKSYVDEFLRFATEHPNYQFHVVAIGCGLAGYRPNQIAPLFANSPSNVHLPNEFK